MTANDQTAATAEEPRRRAFKIYSVTEITNAIRTLITTSAYRVVTVEGEISGWKVSANGHAYFMLKDDNAVISCAMFAGQLAVCAYRDAFKDGAKVQMWGRLDVYPKRGGYQLVVQRARTAGEGELMAKFNELKAKLAAEGLFDESRKRQLPYLPHRIGIVTSPTGAVIHDMVTVLSRRFPNIEVRLYPAKVQGDGATEDVVRGIAYFNDPAQNGGFEADVLIVGRGGGSVEDLWCFNEEPLVRAVAASRIPVISAVGHDTDYTLCDFAADRRAGTPSIAAEIAVPVKDDLVRKVDALSSRVSVALTHLMETSIQHSDNLAMRLSASLKAAASDRASRLADARARLAPALRYAHSEALASVASLSSRLAPALQCAHAKSLASVTAFSARLGPAARLGIAAAETRLARASDKLGLLSPYSVLERGYSLTTDAEGNVVRSASQVKSGDLLRTRLADGTIESSVR